jgi:CheY-like chemotaxis protein
MTARDSLAGCRILVVEDEYLLADELSADLRDSGACVVGPAGTVEAALALLGGGALIAGAILDMSLCGEMAFGVADRLRERGVPFVFTTGYDASQIPARFRHIQRFEKPLDMENVKRALALRIRRRTARPT